MQKPDTHMPDTRFKFSNPAIKVKQVEKWTGLPRPQANELVKKMVDIGVLEQIDKK